MIKVYLVISFMYLVLALREESKSSKSIYLSISFMWFVLAVTEK